jgi:hypothetical protein
VTGFRATSIVVPGVLAGVVALVGAPRAAGAERSWHAGLNLRAELGTHPIRAGGGVGLGNLDVNLTLDPMFWTDGQHDVDLIAGWSPCPRGWGPIAGWRTTAIGLAGGNQYQHKLVVGVSAPLPAFSRRIRARWAFELATVIVKHGGDLPSEWISFATGRDFIDLVNFGMFVRIEYAAGL